MFLLIFMKIKTVKVSDKGQISIPRDIREEVGIRRGDELIIIQEGHKILIEKPTKISKDIKEDFADLLLHSENVAKKLWGNKKDEIWDTV